MLVVMLILLTATAMAAISLQATQSELRAAGANRVALQTQYVAEAAMSTSLSWIDSTSVAGTFYTVQLKGQNALPNPPDMALFGEPPIGTNRAWANRTRWEQQRELIDYVTAPLTAPGGLVKRPTAGTQIADPIGTFGPRAAYVPGQQRETAMGPDQIVDYVVDLYDCQQLPVTASAGSQVNQTGSGVPQQFQFYCVVTARGRSYLNGAATKVWDLDAANTRHYTASRFTAAHDARGTVVTPAILAP
jgi:hypothetical protein